MHRVRRFSCTCLWWMGQSSRLCKYLRCKSWRSRSRSRSCILLKKIVDVPEIQTLQCTEYDASAAHALVGGPVVKMDTVPSRHVSFAETLEKVEFVPAMAYRAPETMMTLPATTPLVHAADMTSPASTPQVHAADIEESGLYSDDIKLVIPV